MDDTQSSAPAPNSRLLSVEEQACRHPTDARELASRAAQLAVFGRWLSAAGWLAVGEQDRLRGAILRFPEPVR
jgi:hypothetical protein